MACGGCEAEAAEGSPLMPSTERDSLPEPLQAWREEQEDGTEEVSVVTSRESHETFTAKQVPVDNHESSTIKDGDVELDQLRMQLSAKDLVISLLQERLRAQSVASPESGSTHPPVPSNPLTRSPQPYSSSDGGWTSPASPEQNGVVEEAEISTKMTTTATDGSDVNTPTFSFLKTGDGVPRDARGFEMHDSVPTADPAMGRPSTAKPQRGPQRVSWHDQLTEEDMGGQAAASLENELAVMQQRLEAQEKQAGDLRGGMAVLQTMMAEKDREIKVMRLLLGEVHANLTPRSVAAVSSPSSTSPSWKGSTTVPEGPRPKMDKRADQGGMSMHEKLGWPEQHLHSKTMQENGRKSSSERFTTTKPERTSKQSEVEGVMWSSSTPKVEAKSGKTPVAMGPVRREAAMTSPRRVKPLAAERVSLASWIENSAASATTMAQPRSSIGSSNNASVLGGTTKRMESTLPRRSASSAAPAAGVGTSRPLAESRVTPAATSSSGVHSPPRPTSARTTSTREPRYIGASVCAEDGATADSKVRRVPSVSPCRWSAAPVHSSNNVSTPRQHSQTSRHRSKTPVRSESRSPSRVRSSATGKPIVVEACRPVPTVVPSMDVLRKSTTATTSTSSFKSCGASGSNSTPTPGPSVVVRPPIVVGAQPPTSSHCSATPGGSSSTFEPPARPLVMTTRVVEQRSCTASSSRTAGTPTVAPPPLSVTRQFSASSVVHSSHCPSSVRERTQSPGRAAACRTTHSGPVAAACNTRLPSPRLVAPSSQQGVPPAPQGVATSYGKAYPLPPSGAPAVPTSVRILPPGSMPNVPAGGLQSGAPVASAPVPTVTVSSVTQVPSPSG